MCGLIGLVVLALAALAWIIYCDYHGWSDY